MYLSSRLILGVKLIISILYELLLHVVESLGEVIYHLLWGVTKHIQLIGVKNKVNHLQIFSVHGSFNLIILILGFRFWPCKYRINLFCTFLLNTSTYKLIFSFNQYIVCSSSPMFSQPLVKTLSIEYSNVGSGFESNNYFLCPYNLWFCFPWLLFWYLLVDSSRFFFSSSVCLVLSSPRHWLI